MFEKAEYFSKKLIRNGIVGFFLTFFLFLTTLSKGESINQRIIILPLIAFLCLIIGIFIKQKLKLKNPSMSYEEIPTERMSYKQVEAFLSLALIVALIPSINQWRFSVFLTLPLFAIYFLWLFSQLKQLINYLNKS